ncbi:CbrC family protein [Bacillus bingmayongensis]|uniref:CbrC family protein n=1 Tax=Bacillus bingmayongensis TaxID=1150157 RepID=UPI000306E640|nr:CbrC family protein [Bacillus bingmayongensis]MBY0597819.1 CbrC family protein [Bacillus bingmayongensis]
MIRQAKQEEIVIVRGWLQETAISLKQKGIQQWGQFLRYENTKIIEFDFEKGYLFVFENDQNQIIASISLCDKEEWDASLWNDEIDAYYIHRIVVSKEGKGLNIGSQFIQWAKNRARESGKKLRLDCVSSNDFLQEFYQKLGLSFSSFVNGFSLYEWSEVEESLPSFKYNKNPLGLLVIREADGMCPVCRRKTGYVYDGPFYTTFDEEETENICPWCIANGFAAQKFDGEFNYSGEHMDVQNKEYTDELFYRTPSYFSWQGEYWLSHCNDYCAIIDEVGWKEIAHLEHELNDDIEKIINKKKITREDFKGMLYKKGHFTGYLFQCVHCSKHRLYVDMS